MNGRNSGIIFQGQHIACGRYYEDLRFDAHINMALSQPSTVLPHHYLVNNLLHEEKWFSFFQHLKFQVQNSPCAIIQYPVSGSK